MADELRLRFGFDFLKGEVSETAPNVAGLQTLLIDVAGSRVERKTVEVAISLPGVSLLLSNPGGYFLGINRSPGAEIISLSEGANNPPVLALKPKEICLFPTVAGGDLRANCDQSSGVLALWSVEP